LFFCQIDDSSTSQKQEELTKDEWAAYFALQSGEKYSTIKMKNKNIFSEDTPTSTQTQTQTQTQTETPASQAKVRRWSTVRVRSSKPVKIDPPPKEESDSDDEWTKGSLAPVRKSSWQKFREKLMRN